MFNKSERNFRLFFALIMSGIPSAFMTPAFAADCLTHQIILKEITISACDAATAESLSPFLSPHAESEASTEILSKSSPTIAKVKIRKSRELIESTLNRSVAAQPWSVANDQEASFVLVGNASAKCVASESPATFAILNLCTCDTLPFQGTCALNPDKVLQSVPEAFAEFVKQ